MNRHHIICQSRIADDCEKHHGNIVMWDKEFHSTYHKLFMNLLPDEITEFLNILNTPGMVWTKDAITQLREQIIARRPTIERYCKLCDRKMRPKCNKRCDICGECW